MIQYTSMSQLQFDAVHSIVNAIGLIAFLLTTGHPHC